MLVFFGNILGVLLIWGVFRVSVGGVFIRFYFLDTVDCLRVWLSVFSVFRGRVDIICFKVFIISYIVRLFDVI